MKRIIYYALGLVLAIGCAKPYPGFVLNGKIEGMGNGKIYLCYTDSLGNQVSDSAAVAAGKFVFRGGINEPTDAYIVSSLKVMNMDDPGFTTLWIEPGEQTLQLNTTNFKDFVLTGSVTNDEAQALKQLKAPIQKELQPLIDAYMAEKDHEKASEMRDSWAPYQDRMAAIDKDFMEKHPDSYLTAQLLRYKTGSMTYEEAQAAYDRLSERVKKSAMAGEIRDELKSMRMGAPGSLATMFSKTDINGEMFNLADLKGKYVLIDFWASWCVPCRKSNPHLKAVYKKYRDKGFEVVCVSDDDRDEAKWKAAVEKDGIQEFKHVLRGLKWVDNRPDKSEDVSEFYGIHSLPTKILIDREGMIIGRYGGGGGTEADMDQKLKEIFGV